MQALPHYGSMMSIRADENTVVEVLQPYADTVSVAAINGPESIVIAGETDAVRAIGTQFTANGIETRELTVSHAFHSPLMEPMLSDFAAVAKTITYHSPKLDVISNLTGQRVTNEMGQPEYWVRHVREAVRFKDGMAELAKQGCHIFLETGPQPTLLGMGRQCIQVEDALWLPSLRRGRTDWQQLLDSLGGLFVQGLAINWRGFEQDTIRHAVSLPTYPFQRQRHWLPGANQAKKRGGDSLRPLVDKIIQSSLLKQTILETEFSTAIFPFLKDHKVFDEFVVPGALILP